MKLFHKRFKVPRRHFKLKYLQANNNVNVRHYQQRLLFKIAINSGAVSPAKLTLEYQK